MATESPLLQRPPDLLESLIRVLTRYVSSPTAHSIVKLAKQRTARADEPLDRALVGAMLAPIEHHLRLYIEEAPRRAECLRAVRALMTAAAPASALGPPSSRPGLAARIARSVRIEIRVEDDINRARGTARDFAVEGGFSVVGQTRLVTAVSELARNIVLYAREGTIELCAMTGPDGIEIVAHDDGPGIPNLEEVLGGRYKSKLGMGLGLSGVKRLAQRFDVKTAPGKGTTVTAFLKVV